MPWNSYKPSVYDIFLIEYKIGKILSQLRFFFVTSNGGSFHSVFVLGSFDVLFEQANACLILAFRYIWVKFIRQFPTTFLIVLVLVEHQLVTLDIKSFAPSVIGGTINFVIIVFLCWKKKWKLLCKYIDKLFRYRSSRSTSFIKLPGNFCSFY